MDASFSADEHLRLGQEALRAGHHAAALEQFRAAHRLDPSSPVYRSYFGLGLACAERRFDRALELCRSAAREEFFNPHLYHNLARVHLAFGFKSEAIRYLRRGLMIDPGCSPIREDLDRLGMRQRPVLGFLRRRHLLNRWMGRIRRRFARAELAGDGWPSGTSLPTS